MAPVTPRSETASTAKPLTGTGSFLRAALSSASSEWATPLDVFAALAAEFGPFDLDPAANAANAKCARFYTYGENGLAQPWHGRVWLNPPYGRAIGDWMAKAAREVAAGRAERVVCLVPARTDTRWWREATAAASLVRFVPGRICFGTSGRAPFPNAVVVLGTLQGRHSQTARACAACGQMWFPARADAKTCSPACRKALSRSRINRASRDAPVAGHAAVADVA